MAPISPIVRSSIGMADGENPKVTVTFLYPFPASVASDESMLVSLLIPLLEKNFYLGNITVSRINQIHTSPDYNC